MSEGASANAVNTPRSSSSPELSSPPRSLSDPGSPAAQQPPPDEAGLLQGTHHHSITVHLAVAADAQHPPRKKPGRKPKAAADGSSNSADPPPPKPKKARKARDPNAPPALRKKKSITHDADAPPAQAAAHAAAQAVAAVPKMTSSVASRPPAVAVMASMADVARPNEPAFAPRSLPSPDTLSVPSSQTGKCDDIPRPANSFFGAAAAPPPPPPQMHVRTSGQNYDPIRSNYDPVRETVVSHTTFSTAQMSPKPVPLVNRASASPSISSLVDPPNQTGSPSLATQSFFSHQMKMQAQDGHASVPPSPTTSRLAPSPMIPASAMPAPAPVVPNQPPPLAKAEKPSEPWAKSAVPPVYSLNNGVPPPGPLAIAKKPGPNAAASTASSSAAPSPKPSKHVDVTPPPLPGSGLQNGIFTGDLQDGAESRAPTIVLHVSMNGESNKYINFTRMAEDIYGWEALHPRQAAQKERLARAAAAGAALEKMSSNKGSGDEMSLDNSDGEGSNAEMGGMSDGRTGTDGGKKVVRKRKTREDEYDKDDDFVDDSELLWQEQAAASKDGFFVYSGPLVPEGEKPLLERADGAPKRGRGGRGRGGAARGAATTTARGAAATTARGGTTAGGGPGSRGGSVARKPRITKADRERIQQEKVEREKMGMLVKPSGYTGLSQLASAASIGGTPMMFNQ